MPRALRYQNPGAVCHLMARGDGGKATFETDEDRLAVEALVRMKLPTGPKELAKKRKGDGCKVRAACLVRQRTSAGNSWIAKCLAMGQSGTVIRRVTIAAKHPQAVRELGKLSRMLKCDT